MDINRSEVKITIAKLLELAYSKNKGLTAKIMAGKSTAKLIIDQNGNANLIGNVGIVSFSGSPALEQLGVTVKNVSVNFRNKDGMKVGYIATIDVKLMSITVVGDFDLEALITSCSGILCRAAKLMKGRHHAYDLELQRIMGM